MRWNRILHKSGSLTDHSIELSDPLVGSGSSLTILSTDYLYIASELPFNHKYFDLTAVNAASASVSVDYWSGSAWVAAVDIVDETKTGAASLAKSGRISWSVDYDSTSWSADDTDEMANTDLESLKIRNLFWCRLKWSANLTNPVTIRYVGHRFSEDEHLEAEYPDLGRSEIKAAFKTGKTNWKDQALVAAQDIIHDLKELGVVKTKDQILDWEVFKKASVQKTAAIIFNAFGDDYRDQKRDALNDYRAALKARIYRIDQNADTILDFPEAVERKMEFLSR